MDQKDKIIKDLQQELLFVIEAVMESDKTPSYGYTSHKCDLNRKGQHAGMGKRWLTPIEVVRSCKERLLLNNLITKNDELEKEPSAV